MGLIIIAQLSRGGIKTGNMAAATTRPAVQGEGNEMNDCNICVLCDYVVKMNK